MSFSQFPTFFGFSNVTKVYLKVENNPHTVFSGVPLQNQERLNLFPEQSSLIELHPVFSHINFLLIETLSVTQHGDFTTRSKQGKYQTIVELGGHVSQRYCLTREDLKEIQQIYDQVLEAWIGWKLHLRDQRE